MKLSLVDLAREGEIATPAWWAPEYRCLLDEILDRRPFFPVEVGLRCICDPIQRTVRTAAVRVAGGDMVCFLRGK